MGEGGRVVRCGPGKPRLFRRKFKHLEWQPELRHGEGMTAKQFYDWQTAGGTDDVMRLVDCLERADLLWCAIGGSAVNHWAVEPMVS